MFTRKKAKRRERLELWLVVVNFTGMGGRSWGASRVRGLRGRERLVVLVGAACANAGSAHGVVRGADNRIEDEGAVALAAALQGNTTMQTLVLSGIWTARTHAFCGNCGAARGT